MTDIEAYLDQACAGLDINPAQADDIREELRSHLEESLLNQGIELNDAAAVEAALSGFGDPNKLADFLGLVHRGVRPERKYLRGFGLGLLLGFLLALGASGTSGFSHFLRLFTTPLTEEAHFFIWFNGLVVAGLLGLLSTKGRHLLLGWWLGVACWLVEFGIYWSLSLFFGKSPGIPKPPTSTYHLLLIPVWGGSFGLFITFGSNGLAYLISRLRPEIH